MKLLKYLLSWRTWLLIIVSGFILTSVFIVLSNYIIIRSTRSDIYVDWDKIPVNDVGLVLGSNTNQYFHNRIEAAALLFHQGKIKHIIVSGDNHIASYDEATAMMNALIKLGVPKENITRDYAGFRTLDSVVRSKKVFGQSKITIISQRFHLQRAIFIANHYAINAVGFAAGDVNGAKTGYREYLAKCKAILDLYILNTKPRFLGEPIKISI